MWDEETYSSAIRCRRKTGASVRRLPRETLLKDMSCSNEIRFRFSPFALYYFHRIQNGNAVAVADEDGNLYIVNTNAETGQAGRVLQSWQAHCNSVFDMVSNDDDTRLFTCSGDRTVAVWDVETMQSVLSLQGHAQTVKCLRLNPEDSSEVVTSSRDGHVILWDLRQRPTRETAPGDFVCAPRRILKNIHVNLNFQDGRSRMRRKDWDPSAGSSHSVSSVCYLDHGRLLVTAGASDGKLKLWDLRMMSDFAAPKPLLELMDTSVDSEGTCARSSRSRGIGYVEADRNFQRLLTCCVDSSIRVYEVSRIGLSDPLCLRGHHSNSYYMRASFSPCADYVACGSSDARVYIYSANRRTDPVILRSHLNEVTAVAWHRQNFAQIASVSDDSTARIWRLSRRSHRPFPFSGPRAESAPGAAPRRRLLDTSKGLLQLDFIDTASTALRPLENLAPLHTPQRPPRSVTPSHAPTPRDLARSKFASGGPLGALSTKQTQPKIRGFFTDQISQK